MLVDVLIVLIVIYAVSRNWGTGFVSQFFSAIGLVGGIFLGRLLQSYTVTLLHTPDTRAGITILSIFGVGLIGLSIGEFIGLNFKYRLVFKRFNTIDNYFGSILTGVTVLAIVWLAASVINTLPATRVKAYVNKSHIIAEMDKVLPAAPGVIADLGKIIDPNGFPDVFIGSEPIPNTNITTPTLGSLLGVVNADRDSVVRIQGTGCGGVVSGSGFVFANGLVATDAHVVAGIANPYIQDVNGKHDAKVIYFDPNLDLAVLKTTGLAGTPLKLDLKTLAADTPGAVLGYPGGGGFEANPAAVMQEFQASGHDIYGAGVTLRDVYEIKADVIPGNSGGPLISSDGEVMGVVFAQSTAYNHVGYALAMPKVATELNQAKLKTRAISTGECAE
jgi:S1-C subfamily serine protease